MASVVLVAFLVPLGLLARSLAEERALAAARQDAQTVAVFAGGATQDDALLQAALLTANDGHLSTTVFLPGGAVVGAQVARTDSVELAALGRAFTARTTDGVEVLLPVGGTGGVAVVRTFVPQAELTDGVARSWAVLAVVGAVLLGGTALVGDRIAVRLSRSVQDLASVADRLGAGDLTARVEPSGPPEVASVGRVLNGLGERVVGLLADERELVADLSHRVRTPITALRLDVETLDDPDERERMTRHVDDLVEAVDTVIRTARDERPAVPPRCDAAEVVRDRARFWGVLAAHAGRDLQVHLPSGPAPVGLTAADLGAALDVLVDNVFRHTPEGTPFAIAVARSGETVTVTVADEGPGLADDELADRGASGSGSTGLGLDVARRTAERAGGTFQVGTGAGTGMGAGTGAGAGAGPGTRLTFVLPARP
ncbi:two-component sensor histidine kinase [Cellulomonas soli]|uniref:Signal transduction histidine-protein kinase/phosphatase MprB n=2 Tax=Cellulomonas soli TaxID=931535 RepID=A0A512PEK6_9CELL|nr:two-component sensor histidine kinase [Cellulomonas soli]